MNNAGITVQGRTVESLPFSKKVIYALGQLGWSLASYGAANFLNYFYLPPQEGGSALFPKMIHQGYIVGVLTVIGLILAFGRIWDAITDPLIAVFSDKNKSKIGRRRFFMAIAVLPFALFAVLVFVAPFGTGDQANITANGFWLFVAITLFYFFMTMYVTPFFAWMSELGHSSNERLELSTMISITWALGAMIGAQAPALQGMFQAQGMSPLQAFQAAQGVFALVSFILMVLPIIVIDENRYAESVPCDDGFFTSIGNVIKDRNFLSKIGQSIGAVLLPSIVMIGAGTGGSGDVVGVTGVRLTTLFAFAFCVIGFILLLFYNEKQVQEALAKHQQNK